MAYTALLDANVLHPMVLCDLLVRLAQQGLYRARWSRKILEETVDSIARRRADIPVERLQRRIDLMNAAISDAEVEGCDELIPALDHFGSDAHVVAAAILGRADVIVTSNLADFPASVLSRYDLTAQSPDDFLLAQWGLRPAVVLRTIHEQAAALRNPPMSALDVVSRLREIVPKFADVVAVAMKDDASEIW